MLVKFVKNFHNIIKYYDEVFIMSKSSSALSKHYTALTFIPYGLRPLPCAIGMTANFIWMLLQTVHDTWVSKITSSVINRQPDVLKQQILTYFIIVVIWLSVEFVGDIYTVINQKDIETSRKYRKKWMTSQLQCKKENKLYARCYRCYRYYQFY